MPLDKAVGFVVVIPALNPQVELVALVGQLSAAGVNTIVIVDDGSSRETASTFEAVSRYGVHVLRHAVNLGKGAALKTGINYALCNFPDAVGVVTGDADGQHSAADILKIGELLSERPDALILGRREFGPSAPSRSRVGNILTSLAVQLLIGKRISDTQTGLRGIPAGFARQLLSIASPGYEFELDMLITAKHEGRRIVEAPIETIYLAGNASSHFNPLRDSMRVYFALLRFTGVALVTAVIDNAVFLMAFQYGGNILGSQILGRAVAVIFNYTAARKAVFFSHRKHVETLPAYLLLVFASGLASYTLIRMFGITFGWRVFPSKLIAESLLFLVNFLIQRDWVFTRRRN